METKENEINIIKNRLYGLWSFIAPNLPLANSQVCDFIVKDLWEEIPVQIQEELLLMSDPELASLPSQSVKTSLSLRTDSVAKPKKMSETCDIRQIPCPYLKSNAASCIDADRKEQACSLQHSVSTWKHSTLDAFVEEAQRHVLDSDVLTTSAELQAYWPCETARVCGRLPGVLMSQKKCHEVDVMAELCAQLSKSFSTNLTVDVGSGKGYLSTQLCCEFDHCVIGIDAAQTNTAGATKRAGRLTQDWKSYAGNFTTRARGGCQTSEEKRTKLLDTVTVDQDVSKAIPSVGAGDNLSSVLEHFSDLTIETTLNENTNSNSAIDCSEHYGNQDLLASLGQKQEDHVRDALGESRTEVDKSISPVFSHTPGTDSKEPPKKDPKSNWSDKFIPLTKFVDPDMNLMDSIRDATEQLQLDPKCARILLTGLHTCGGLGASVLKMFVNSKSVSVLCNVACCYNLLEEEFVSSTEHTLSGASCVSHFPMSSYLRNGEVGLGKAARNVACLSVHRMAVEEKLQGHSFYPRVLLQKIILDSGQRVKSETIKLRKLQKRSKSLYEYVRMAFTKMGLQTDKITRELVESYHVKYGHVKHQLAAFVQLRAVLAPCIEAFILLDRFLYLLEQENVKDVHLSKVFDLVVSPRCYALIAIKKSVY